MVRSDSPPHVGHPPTLAKQTRWILSLPQIHGKFITLEVFAYSSVSSSWTRIGPRCQSDNEIFQRRDTKRLQDEMNVSGQSHRKEEEEEDVRIKWRKRTVGQGYFSSCSVSTASSVHVVVLQRKSVNGDDEVLLLHSLDGILRYL